jgi:hypothetical protein
VRLRGSLGCEWTSEWSGSGSAVVVGCWFFLVESTYDTPIMIMLFRSSHFPLLFFACPSFCDADSMNAVST